MTSKKSIFVGWVLLGLSLPVLALLSGCVDTPKWASAPLHLAGAQGVAALGGHDLRDVALGVRLSPPLVQ